MPLGDGGTEPEPPADGLKAWATMTWLTILSRLLSFSTSRPLHITSGGGERDPA